VPNQKITELAAITVADPEDLLAVVEDPAATAVTKNIGFGKFLKTYNRSAAEISEGLSNDDLDFKEDKGNVIRYGENSVPGTTPMADAIQKAVNTNRKVTLPLDPYFIGTTTITISKATIFTGEGASFFDTDKSSELIYAGTGAALLIDPGAAKISNCFSSNLRITASGDAITSGTATGLKIINSNYAYGRRYSESCRPLLRRRFR